MYGSLWPTKRHFDQISWWSHVNHFETYPQKHLTPPHPPHSHKVSYKTWLKPMIIFTNNIPVKHNACEYPNWNDCMIPCDERVAIFNLLSSHHFTPWLGHPLILHLAHHPNYPLLSQKQLMVPLYDHIQMVYLTSRDSRRFFNEIRNENT